MSRFAELDALDQATWILIDGELEFTNVTARREYPQITLAEITQLSKVAGETWKSIDQIAPAIPATSLSTSQVRAASWGNGQRLLQLRPTAADADMLASLLDALPQRIACLNNNNQLLWVNTPMSDKFDCTREAMAGMSLADFLPPGIALELEQATHTARSSGRTTHYYNNGLSNPESDERELMSELTPLDNQSGQLIINCTDVSLQQPIRSQAAAKTVILERIARADPIAVVLSDLVKHVRVYSNAISAAIMLAVPDDSAEQIERGRFTVVAASALPAFVQNALEGQPVALESGPCGSSAIYGRRRFVDDIPSIEALQPIAGKLRQANMNACWSEPISSPNGLVIGSMVVYFHSMADEAQHRELISNAALATGIAIERGENERRLISINAELEQRVAERTQALTRSLRDIEYARNEAESATKAKSRFLAAASHDLRQPLQALSLYLSALQNSPPQTDFGPITEKIGNAVTAMNDTLASLLDITSIASGKINTNPQPFPIARTLARLKSVHDPRAEAAGLTFELECTDCEIISDEALFYRILDNLLTNAISYTEAGRVNLRCLVDHSQVRIEVSDTGVGIASNQHERIFEEYVQLRNPGRTRKMGMGLGLAVVAQLCKLLDHDLQVASEPGVGSTFSVCANRASQPAVPINARPEEPRSVAIPANANPRVLFVDDDEDIVDAMTLMMNNQNIELLACYCANEAISMLERGVEPDLLITDLRLPDISGNQLIHKARRVLGTELPAILITGHASTMESAGLPNDVDLLKKPVKTEALLALIEKKVYRPIAI